MDHAALTQWVAEQRPQPARRADLLVAHQLDDDASVLPVVHRSFDPHDVSHWLTRARSLTYRHAAAIDGKLVLDFAPGRGWPLLGLAEWAAELHGADVDGLLSASPHRVGLANASLHSVPAGRRLPFMDGELEAAVSVGGLLEARDPTALLHEIRRVLRPGARLAFSVELPGPTDTVEVLPVQGLTCRIVVTQGQPQRICAYGIEVARPAESVVVARDDTWLPYVTAVRAANVYLADFASWQARLTQAGFSRVHGAKGEMSLVRRLYAAYHHDTKDEADVTAVLDAPVQSFVVERAPAETFQLVVATASA